MGRPIIADKATEEREHFLFARLLIEIDFASKPKDVVHIRDELGNITDQRVFIEWKPLVCTHCGILGHSEDKCRNKASCEDNNIEPTIPVLVQEPTKPAVELQQLQHLDQAQAEHDPCLITCVGDSGGVQLVENNLQEVEVQLEQTNDLLAGDFHSGSRNKAANQEGINISVIIGENEVNASNKRSNSSSGGKKKKKSKKKKTSKKSRGDDRDSSLSPSQGEGLKSFVQ